MVKLDLGLVLVICGKLGSGRRDEVLLGRNIVNHMVHCEQGKDECV